MNHFVNSDGRKLIENNKNVKKQKKEKQKGKIPSKNVQRQFRKRIIVVYY